ncbi:CPBP family intramembrane glutamic endopeptidase [Pajaroellobacter abortibovis]|uniref:CAAX prenyl protease 2/Lysostaphin resistance protein A-like domain-containing protein n=1 Tax=Pajaroellobacter abortibovis TaxID=1882918 RepID=A0A1L6MYU0_9BACT|nr:type II CAAX endopeptidase family protein [Pajaroellobacter abortibovis]APS00639.1 hypothetical protein BCY86_08110 [Pajaroellobacter abortibovis]
MTEYTLLSSFAMADSSGWSTVIRACIPVPVLLLLCPLLWLAFRRTWLELDREAYQWREEALRKGTTDLRPFVAMVIAAFVLTGQQYYGKVHFYRAYLLPMVTQCVQAHLSLKLAFWQELYEFGWWGFSCVVGYVVAPFLLWKILFREDSLLDFGLRPSSFFRHVWIYLACLAIVLPAMWVVSSQPDFTIYYPFYQQSSRSWFDFLAWETIYFVQFFSLELFFRGWWLGALRKSMGSTAIFAVAVPYCMIHYGKPYLEAMGAIVAGVALGSLSMQTKSIYQGFLVHITVAGLMDWLALHHRNALPTVFLPPS